METKYEWKSVDEIGLTEGYTSSLIDYEPTAGDCSE